MAGRLRSLMAAVSAVVIVGGAMALTLLRPAAQQNVDIMPLATDAPTTSLGRPLFASSAPPMASPSDGVAPHDDESAPGEDTTQLNVPDSILTQQVPDGPAVGGDRLSNPVAASVMAGFGTRYYPVLKTWKMHTGLDFAADCGTPVGTAAPGVVVSTGWAGGNGVQVRVDHGEVSGQRVVTTYSHLSVIGVTTGQQIQAHQGVGLVGDSGYATSCHLHFEVIADGDFQDPALWLTPDPATASPSPTASPSGEPSSSEQPTSEPEPTATPSGGPTSPTKTPPPTSPPSSKPRPSTTDEPSQTPPAPTGEPTQPSESPKPTEPTNTRSTSEPPPSDSSDSS